MTQNTRVNVLKIMAGLQIIFGGMLVLSAYRPLNSIALGMSEMSGLAAPTHLDMITQSYVVAGMAFMFAFGVLAWTLLSVGIRDSPELVRKALLMGTLAWIGADSLGNLLIGFMPNLISHLVMAAIWIAALWAPMEPQTA